MDNINESSDLVAAQNIAIEANRANDENAETENADKRNGDNDQGNRTDDETASESGASQKSQAVDYTKSNEYQALLKEIKQNLLCATRLQLKNLSALVRRVAVLLLDFLGSTTLDIDELLTSHVRIERKKPQCFLFIEQILIRVHFQELRQLFIDQSQIVRRQLVLSLDKILNAKPTSEAAINAYVKIVLDLANDTDPKVMEVVIESFKRNVFDKIEYYEQSPSLTHVYPWRLIKKMLNCRDSPDFRISIQKWMNRNLLK